MQTETVFTFGDISIQLQLHPLVWAPTGFAQYMALHLAQTIKPGDQVLEIGLGSGVLAILAAKLGADRVTGLDINPQAIALSQDNWCNNGVEIAKADFRRSDLLQSLGSEDIGRFDLIFSNPPVLPDVEELTQEQNSRNDFEKAGMDGRKVLDTVLSKSSLYLKPDGQLLTIATSLQGWRETETMLNTHWYQWETCQGVIMELTDECKQPHIDLWQQWEREDNQKRVYLHNGNQLHEVWFLRAKHPRSIISE
jgi:methylase of polypeptide subunit release factors